MSLQRIFVLLLLIEKLLILVKTSVASPSHLHRSIAIQADEAEKDRQTVAQVQEKQRKVEYILAGLQFITQERKAAEDRAIELRNLAQKSRDEYEKLISAEVVQHAKYRELTRKAKSKALADTQAKVDSDKKVEGIKKMITEVEKQLLEAEDELASAQMLFISKYNGNPSNINEDMQLKRGILERVLGKRMQTTISQSSTQASSLNSDTQTTSSESDTQPTISQSDTQPTIAQSSTHPTSSQSDTQVTSSQSATSYFDTTIPIIKGNPSPNSRNRYLPSYIKNDPIIKNRIKKFSAASKMETEYQGLEPLDPAELSQTTSSESDTQPTITQSDTQPTSAQSSTHPTSSQSDTQVTSSQSATSYSDTTIPIIKGNPSPNNRNRYSPSYIKNDPIIKNRIKKFSAASKMETEYQGLEPLDPAELSQTTSSESDTQPTITQSDTQPTSAQSSTHLTSSQSDTQVTSSQSATSYSDTTIPIIKGNPSPNNRKRYSPSYFKNYPIIKNRFKKFSAASKMETEYQGLEPLDPAELSQTTSSESDTQPTITQSDTQPTSAQSSTHPTSSQSDTQVTSSQSATSYSDTTIPIIKGNPSPNNRNRYSPSYFKNDPIIKNRIKKFIAASKMETEYQGLEPSDPADLCKNLDNSYKSVKPNGITINAKPLHTVVSSDKSMEVKKIKNHNRRKRYAKIIEIKSTDVMSPEQSSSDINSKSQMSTSNIKNSPYEDHVATSHSAGLDNLQRAFDNSGIKNDPVANKLASDKLWLNFKEALQVLKGKLF